MSFDPEPYPVWVTTLIVTALVAVPWAIIWAVVR